MDGGKDGFISCIFTMCKLESHSVCLPSKPGNDNEGSGNNTILCQQLQ